MRRLWLLSLVSLVGVLAGAAVLGLRLPAELRARAEPISDVLPSAGDSPVVVQLDERIFTLFAAYNASGFDDEYRGMQMHPVRVRVREALADREFDREALRNNLYQAHDSKYVWWMLGRGAPPAFGRAVDGWYVEGVPAAFFDRTDVILAQFYEDADIASLWAEVRPEYEAAAAEYEAIAGQAAHDVLVYLRADAPPVSQVAIIPNLVDSYYSGYGPRIGGTAYIVTGPAEDQRNVIGLMQHEMMHPIVGPMVEANLDAITPAARQRLSSAIRKRMPDGYRSFEGAIEETLIRAIGQRMLGDPYLSERMLQQLETEGFFLIRPFYDALERYEQSGLSMEEYMQALLGELNELDLAQPSS